VGHLAPFLAPTDRDREHKILEMAKDPWRDPDPQSADLNAELDHTPIEVHEGNPDAKLSILSRRASRATEMRALLHHARPPWRQCRRASEASAANDRSA